MRGFVAAGFVYLSSPAIPDVYLVNYNLQAWNRTLENCMIAFFGTLYQQPSFVRKSVLPVKGVKCSSQWYPFNALAPHTTYRPVVFLDPVSPSSLSLFTYSSYKGKITKGTYQKILYFCMIICICFQVFNFLFSRMTFPSSKEWVYLLWIYLTILVSHAHYYWRKTY